MHPPLRLAAANDPKDKGTKSYSTGKKYGQWFVERLLNALVCLLFAALYVQAAPGFHLPQPTLWQAFCAAALFLSLQEVAALLYRQAIAPPAIDPGFLTGVAALANEDKDGF